MFSVLIVYEMYMHNTLYTLHKCIDIHVHVHVHEYLQCIYMYYAHIHVYMYTMYIHHILCIIAQISELNHNVIELDQPCMYIYLEQ